MGIQQPKPARRGSEKTGGSAAGPEPNALERSIGVLCIGGAAIATLTVLITLVTTGYSVFLRYALGKPITWIDELSGYLVVAIVMFGAAEALRKDDHIQVDIVTAGLQGWALACMRVVWMAMVIAFTTVLLVSAWDTVNFSRNFGLYSDGYMEMPMWVPQSLLIVGSVLLLLAAIAKISWAIRNITASRDDGS